MSIEDMSLNQTKTLAERLSDGRLPVAEALTYAMQVADSLRKLHDTGKPHGAVSPSNISLTAGGAILLPAPEGSAGTITPYTAPEVVQGRAADERSDIFSFGAVLFEMLSGHRAFDGDSRVILAANLSKAPTPSSGSPLVDRLIAPCLAKNPDARSSRMQRVIMELKLLSVAVRRADMSSAGTQRRDAAAEMGAVRDEVQQLEARFTARFLAQEKSVQDIQRAANEAVGSLKVQLAAMSTELALARQQASERAAGEFERASSEAILNRVDHGFELVDARVSRLESTVEELRTTTSHFEHNIAADLVDLEQSLKVQSSAIESARTAMSQTDDLVERVVEALESLQMAVMDQGEISEPASFAVN